MKRPFWRGLWFAACLGCLGIPMCGCSLSASGPAAAGRHFILGENRISAMDYQGAVREFEESLEADPHSAAAHFQLGWLYDAKVSNPAAAIYHYEKYLELRPDAGNASVVKQRIEACKQKLAADVLALPSMPPAQQQMEQLMIQVQQLRDANRQLQIENQQLQAGLSRWSAYYSRRADQTHPAATEHFACATAAADLSPMQPTEVQSVSPPAFPSGGGPANRASRLKTPWSRHRVSAGETAVRIARHYGISLASLLAANPGLHPRRMPVGLILNIPPPPDFRSSFLALQR